MPNKSLKSFINLMPKAELHIHIEGSLEPELMLRLAEKNKIKLPYDSVEDVRDAYSFDSLQSFLDIYYLGANVLQTAEDFYELMQNYLEKCLDSNILHTEIMFDPQTHMNRGIAFAAMFQGFDQAVSEAREKGMSIGLIMCFLRHLSEQSAFETIKSASPFKDRIQSIGLDSGEKGNPPAKFTRVFQYAKSQGYRLVAHAGEEGPPAYVAQALEKLKVERIDHGVSSFEDPKLVEILASTRLPLTVCPLSNIKLCIYESLQEHPIIDLHKRGVCVTINSDDPAYFGGYLDENYVAVAEAFGLEARDLIALTQNSFEAAFVEDERKKELQRTLSEFIQTQEVLPGPI